MTSVRKIHVLEDDSDRRKRMTVQLGELDPSIRAIMSLTAPAFIRDSDNYCNATCLISLDHDLEATIDESDPGDGLQVAEFLAARKPICPVIVHSSNVERADLMIYLLRNTGWNVERVAPIGKDWIETSWRVEVQKLLAVCA